jgi:hypothetical protein
LTNKEKWDAYTYNLCSPQNYLDWSWRFVISAALERRVWLGYNEMQLFANDFIILVGRAGIGKGVAITPALELLKYWKRKDKVSDNTKLKDQEVIVKEEMEKVNDEIATTNGFKMVKGGEKFDPPLFPFGADSTSFEKLVQHVGKSFRRINYVYKGEDGNDKMGIYGHCSMYFCLPELGSLFRRKTEDTVTFLQALYDCPKDHIYTTIGRGDDRVRMGCLSFLAGVTPEFLEMAFNERVMSQGFSSRTKFIYANKNRKNVILPEALTQEQLGFKKDLLEHVRKLSYLYGRVQIDKVTEDFIKSWWDKYENDRTLRSNPSPKMEHYYARKGVHLLKTALQEHFGENTDFFVPLKCFENAIEILNKEEKNMHMALTFEGKNPLGRLTDKVHSFIALKPRTIVQLMMEFWRDCPNGKQSMEDILSYLINSSKIRTEDENGKVQYISTTQYE